MSYKKEQFIEDFKNAYNQTQQLHYLYKYLKEYDGQIASVNVKKLEEETDNIAYYQFIFTLDNRNVIETDSIAFASYTFVDELDNRVTSINNTITSINNTITSLDRRISNNEGDIVDINDKMLTLPNTAPSTRKVVTINTNGAQDNVDPTELPTLMENIVDSHGNKRFVEGSGTLNAIDGVTITYNKWSLSGTHLMIVLAGNIANGTTISNAQEFSYYRLPSYILNKIIAINANTVNMGDIDIYNSAYGVIKEKIRLFKSSASVTIQKIGNYLVTSDAAFRIQFDLLIDNE